MLFKNDSLRNILDNFIQYKVFELQVIIDSFIFRQFKKKHDIKLPNSRILWVLACCDHKSLQRFANSKDVLIRNIYKFFCVSLVAYLYLKKMKHLKQRPYIYNLVGMCRLQCYCSRYKLSRSTLDLQTFAVRQKLYGFHYKIRRY